MAARSRSKRPRAPARAVAAVAAAASVAGAAAAVRVVGTVVVAAVAAAAAAAAAGSFVITEPGWPPGSVVLHTRASRGVGGQEVRILAPSRWLATHRLPAPIAAP